MAQESAIPIVILTLPGLEPRGMPAEDVAVIKAPPKPSVLVNASTW